MILIKILICLALAIFSFADITTATTTAGGYTPIPQAVRDAYSKEVFFEAQPRCKFLQFAKQKTDFSAVRGKSITYVKYASLSGGGKLTDESSTINTATLAASEVKITLYEHGNSVELTEMLIRTALLDTMEDASKLLATDLAQTLDKQLRDAALATTNVIFGDGATSSASMVSTSVMNIRTVKDVVERLATANAPRINGEYYVCIAHPHQTRTLRDDPAWVSAQAYRGTGRQLFLGEVGMYEGVVFIETTNMPVLTNTAIDTKYGGTYTAGSNGYEAVFFGENAYAWAVGLPVELREDAVKDLGRRRRIGWYGIWGSGVLENNNIVRVLTT